MLFERVQFECSNSNATPFTFERQLAALARDVKMTGVRVITPVNHSCKLNFGSDFNSCDSYFRSDVTPVKSNLGVIFTIVSYVYKSDIFFSWIICDQKY